MPNTIQAEAPLAESGTNSPTSEPFDSKASAAGVLPSADPASDVDYEGDAQRGGNGA